MKSQLYQTLTVFSDGSLSVELASNNNKKVTNLVKDLKNFQKVFKNNSTNHLSNFNSSNKTSAFRKNLFK